MVYTLKYRYRAKLPICLFSENAFNVIKLITYMPIFTIHTIWKLATFFSKCTNFEKFKIIDHKFSVSTLTMSVLSEQWLQDVAESMGLPALNPTICKMMLPVIEVHLKKLSQQANKFQRRAKAKTMTGWCNGFVELIQCLCNFIAFALACLLAVEDLNAALSMNKIESVYGLSKSEHAQILYGSSESNDTTGANSNSSSAAGKGGGSGSKQSSKLVNLGKSQQSTKRV